MPLLERLISSLTPHVCLSCETEGSLLCKSCQQVVYLSNQTYCYHCYKPLLRAPKAALCPECQPQTSLNNVWAATQYSGIPKELVHWLKFNRAQAAAQPMALMMSQLIRDVASIRITKNTLIVPVPTATQRVRQRGYDQALLIAWQLARLQRLSAQKMIKRSGQTRQVGADRKQRLAQLRTTFYVPKSPPVQNVLLVDDILTTGATLETAARVLREAGVKRVDAVVFAQKI